MCKHLYKFLNYNNILYELQFGFRQNFCTTHVLIHLAENIRQALDEGKIGCKIFVDLQKAFDTADYDILLSKLDHYGLHGLTNIGLNHTSLTPNNMSLLMVTTLPFLLLDMGQRFALCPLLFLLYKNHLDRAIKFCKVHHFADDTNLLFLANSIKNFNKLFNIGLKNLSNWLNANKFFLNVKKN